MNFLGEDNIKAHKKYLRDLILKYSIIESSYSKLKGKNLDYIIKSKISKETKNDIFKYLPEINLHKLYFNSFSYEKFIKSKIVESQFENESDLLNRLYKVCLYKPHGFVTVSFRRNRIVISSYDNYLNYFLRETPVLAIDVCEHAYFADYGFKRNEYFIEALSHLNLLKLDEFSQKNCKL